MLFVAPARAQVPEWKAEWPRFRPAEIALTVGSGLQVGYASFFANGATNNFDGPILFDKVVRDGIRARSRDGRTAAATASDLMYYALLFYPLVDAPTFGGVRGGKDVAVQTLAINMESYAVGGAYAIMFEKLGRRRPSARECDRDASYDRRCDDTERLNESAVSGHTSISFIGAGLMCAHHTNLPLYNGRAADLAACITALTLASVQGTLRVVSDNHYATDVLAGAALGLGTGYLMPWLLHYRGTASGGVARWLLPSFSSRELGLHGVLAPRVTSSELGITFNGSM